MQSLRDSAWCTMWTPYKGEVNLQQMRTREKWRWATEMLEETAACLDQTALSLSCNAWREWLVWNTWELVNDSESQLKCQERSSCATTIAKSAILLETSDENEARYQCDRDGHTQPPCSISSNNLSSTNQLSIQPCTWLYSSEHSSPCTLRYPIYIVSTVITAI